MWIYTIRGVFHKSGKSHVDYLIQVKGPVRGGPNIRNVLVNFNVRRR